MFQFQWVIIIVSVAAVVAVVLVILAVILVIRRRFKWASQQPTYVQREFGAYNDEEDFAGHGPYHASIIYGSLQDPNGSVGSKVALYDKSRHLYT